MSDTQVEEFLEHYGVQGMKWGVRKAANKANVERLKGQGLSNRQAKNTNRAQNRVDMMRMTAKGRDGKVSVTKQVRNRMASNTQLGLTTVLRHPLSSKNAAARQLQKNEEMRGKVLNGEKRITATLLKVGGVSIKDLDYSI